MLSDKYLWNLTQNFEEYSDIIDILKTIEDKKIGSYCKIFKDKSSAGNLIYIWFKGTELSIKDILVDIFFFKKRIVSGIKENDLKKPLLIHAGFWSAVESIYYKTHKFISKNLDNNGIVIFGHSLGGAMSKECARRLEEIMPRDLIRVVTFGTPRTGNKWYAKVFDDYYMTEYMMRGDIVGKLPLAIWGFRHTRHLKKIGKLCMLKIKHKNYGLFL